jgi:hypothetical protein
MLFYGLVDWGGPASDCPEALTVALGCENTENLGIEGRRIADDIYDSRAVSARDWTRALFAAEIIFVSDLLGTGSELTTSARSTRATSTASPESFSAVPMMLEFGITDRRSFKTTAKSSGTFRATMARWTLSSAGGQRNQTRGHEYPRVRSRSGSMKEAGSAQVIRRLLCCFCGQSTDDAPDYLQMELGTDLDEEVQFLGAHSSCLDPLLAGDFRIEIH